MKKIIIFSLLLLTYVSSIQAQKSTVQTQNAYRKLQMAEYFISRLYVDKVDENKIVEDGIKGMLEKLDPHSTYSNADEVKELNEPLQGGFEGIGVQFNMIKDTLFIIQPVSGGPSARAGILAGDRIIKVDGKNIAGVKMSTEEIMKRLKGPKGTKVILDIIRRGIEKPISFNITRDKIPVYSIDASYMIAPKTGYIKISRFAETTHDEFIAAMKKLKKQNMDNLILDLQGNGGGYLKAAIDIANEFLNKKELIVYTEGRTSGRDNFFADGSGQFLNGRLIVLVDEFTASASEIVSGAIQDWDRGVIVGRRSFGKGLVQRPISLPDNSMIRLTVARYYTPAGRCIQKPYNSTIDYDKDLIKRYNNGEMTTADSIHFPDSLKCLTQRLNRVVYGGGGIMPDCFVPIDTTTIYYRQLLVKNIIPLTINQYIEQHRNDLLKKYKNVQEYIKNFNDTPTLLSILLSLAKKEGITYDQKGYDASIPLLTNQLKALVARDLWSENDFYQVINQSNDSLNKALEIIKSEKYDKILSPIYKK